MANGIASFIANGVCTRSIQIAKWVVLPCLCVVSLSAGMPVICRVHTQMTHETVPRKQLKLNVRRTSTITIQKWKHSN